MGTDKTRTLTVERSTSTAHKLTHYDGACSNVHGHNMKWDVEVTVDMGYSGRDNMPVDLKKVSDIIDTVDHAFVVNVDDPIVEDQIGDVPDSMDLPKKFEWAMLGEVWVFDGDPTCEVMASWMESRLRALPSVKETDLTVYETEKYGVQT